MKTSRVVFVWILDEITRCLFIFETIYSVLINNSACRPEGALVWKGWRTQWQPSTAGCPGSAGSGRGFHLCAWVGGHKKSKFIYSSFPLCFPTAFSLELPYRERLSDRVDYLAATAYAREPILNLTSKFRKFVRVDKFLLIIFGEFLKNAYFLK